MKRMFTLAAGAALTFALGCGGNSASPTAPGQPGSSEFTGPSAIVSLKIEAPATLTVGDTAQVKVVATLAGGGILDVTSKALLSVSNAAVATVSASGELRALAPGDCGLTAVLGAISASLNTHIRARAGNIIRLDIRGKVDLELGEKTQLLAIATLDTGGELDVTAKASFSSSNEALLRASASGLLEAVGAGTCDLLSIVDGIRASVKVNVRGRGDDGTSEHITRLEIRGKVALDLGEKTQLQAIALLNTGAEVNVTAKVTFSSSNEAILKVSTSGLLEAVGSGTGDILSIVDGIRASVKVEVRDRPGTSDHITRLDIRGKVALDIGEKAQLRVLATLNTGAEVDVTARAVLKSQNDAVLRVTAAGVIEAIGIGASVLVATVDGISASVPADVSLGAIVKLDIEGLAELTVGERVTVKVMGTNAHGIKVDVTAKTDLSSSNSSILRVNVGGVIDALGPGSCDLIALHAGVRAVVRLSVKPKGVVLVKLRIEGPNVLKVGQTASLRVFASMSDDTEVDVTGRVIWSSNNLLSLVVDASGLLRALIPGDCLVTGVVDGIRATASVKVTL